MAIIKLNGQEFDTDQMSDSAKAQLNMLRAAEAEIMRLQAQLAMTQTARGVYAKALAEALGIK